MRTLLSALFILTTITAPCLTGCNALLGNDEGIGSNADPSEAEKNNAGDAIGDAGSRDSTTKDASINPSTDDSKAPCANCEPDLIVSDVGEVKSLQVTATHVYWATANGAYRVARSAAPCQTADCREKIDTGSFGQVSVGADDTHIYWSTWKEFGSADPATLKSKKADASSFPGSGAGISLVNGYAYFVLAGYSVGSADSLVRGVASKLVDGTGGITPVSESGAGIDTFTATNDYVAWATQTRRVYVQLSGAEAIELRMPKTTGWWINSLSVHNGYAYVSAFGSEGHIYRAPIDGSEEATGYYDVPAARQITVNSSGAYIGFGDGANNVSSGIGWNPIDPNAKGSADGKVLVELGDNQVKKMQVTDTAIYYATYPRSSGGAPGIWKIAFDR